MCFLFGKKGHISNKFDLAEQPNAWVEIRELPEKVLDGASSVWSSLRSDLLVPESASARADATNCPPITDRSFNQDSVLSFSKSSSSTAEPENKPKPQSYSSLLSRTDTYHLSRKKGALDINTSGWTIVVIMDQSGSPWIQGHAKCKQHA